MRQKARELLLMSDILEVAVGLVFVYLLFSHFVSALNEAIFGHLTHLRSRVLEDSLHSILSGQARGFTAFSSVKRGFRAPIRKAGSFSEALLAHPLVEGLAVGRQRCPSYLPGQTFVDAVIGTLLGP